MKERLFMSEFHLRFRWLFERWMLIDSTPSIGTVKQGSIRDA